MFYVLRKHIRVYKLPFSVMEDESLYTKFDYISVCKYPVLRHIVYYVNLTIKIIVNILLLQMVLFLLAKQYV